MDLKGILLTTLIQILPLPFATPTVQIEILFDFTETAAEYQQDKSEKLINAI